MGFICIFKLIKDAGFSSEYYYYHKRIKPLKTSISDQSKGSDLKELNDEPKNYYVNGN